MPKYCKGGVFNNISKICENKLDYSKCNKGDI